MRRSDLSDIFQLAPRGPLLAIFPKYGRALAIIAIGTAIRYSLTAGYERSGFAITLVAMLIAAWTGGLPASLLAQTAVLLIEGFLFSRPESSRPNDPIRSAVGTGVFYLVGSVVALLSEFASAAQQRALARTNETLAERERLRAILSCIGDAVLVTDNAGRLTLLNPLAEQLIGLPAAGCLGKPLDAIYRTTDRQSGQSRTISITEVLVAGADVHCDAPLLLHTTGGQSLPITYIASPIRDADGATTGVVLVVHDETEREAAEKMLRDADRRKDEFLATLAHELRNPLAPISTGLELMKLGAGDSQLVEETRATMERQTRHMVRLIDDLLDVSRITRGKLTLRRTNVDLAEIVRNALDAVRPLIEQSGKHLTVLLPQGSCRVYVDGQRMTQVLTNLLDNAAKFTPAGGRIVLSVAREASGVLVSIKDSGVGIPREMQSRIFEMFTQASHSLETGAKGLGIGLTIVKSLVEMHGGTIGVHSDGENRGSEFTLRLPVLAREDSVAAALELEPAAADSKGRRVLVVDDNEDALLTLSRIIQMLGHHVLTATNGIKALEAARKFRPEVVLMDLGMPDLNGYDAARQIRQEAWSTNTLLVATTGWGQDQDKQRSRAAGFDKHLVKPIELAEIQKVLQRDTQLAPA